MKPLKKKMSKDATGEVTPRRPGARVLLVNPGEAHLAAVLGLLNEHAASWLLVETAAEATDRFDASRQDAVVLFADEIDDATDRLLASLAGQDAADRVVLLCARPTFELASDAMRRGVTEILTCPVDAAALRAAIDRVASRARRDREQERKVARLKDVCRRLHQARQDANEQVETLSNDLVVAYRDLSRQIADATLASEFRTLLHQELDLEDLLRTSLEYLLSKVGPTNAAVFLPEGEGEWSLGAYVNYDRDRESVEMLFDHLGNVVAPRVAEEAGVVRVNDRPDLLDADAEGLSFLGGCDTLAFACDHAGETMAVIVLFRERADAFTPELIESLDIMRGIFARQVDRVVKIHRRAEPAWPKEPADEYDDDFGGGEGIAA